MKIFVGSHELYPETLSRYAPLYPNVEYFQMGQKAFRKGTEMPKHIKNPVSDDDYAKYKEWLRGYNDGFDREYRLWKRIENERKSNNLHRS